ncbi:unnamed protein product [Linum tenue]|uniref:Secreted protein n=1 Tax=Linum tenue TaxID=586396 RepID=A0AAV0IPT7_9ROSI|nr:unnamed protein product [Linum tenue]
MANAILNMLAHCAFGMSSSVSIHDTVIERRPYHKNCECALHKLKCNCSHISYAQTNLSFSSHQKFFTTLLFKSCFSIVDFRDFCKTTSR